MTSSDQSNIVQNIPQYCLMTCGESCISGLYQYGFMVSTFFGALAVLVSLYNTIMHFINFNNPYFQSKIIIILLMPVIYCITSTICFLFVRYSSYITIMKNFYEVIVLFAFVYLIFSFLAYNHSQHLLQEQKVYRIMIQSKQIPHQFPWSTFQKPYQLSNWLKAKYFSHRTKRAIIQYILIKIATTVFLFVVYPNFQLINHKTDDWDYILYGYANVAIYWLTTISSYLAFYYLALFYSCLQAPLQPYKPDLKFITFNAAIFYTYWQRILLVIFQSDIIACFDQNAESFHQKKVMYGLQNILICIQMFVVSYACAEAYNYRNYVVTNLTNFGSILYILKDIFTIFMEELRLFKPKKFGFNSNNDKTETELLTITSSMSKREQSCRVNIRYDICSKLIKDYF